MLESTYYFVNGQEPGVDQHYPLFCVLTRASYVRKPDWLSIYTLLLVNSPVIPAGHSAWQHPQWNAQAERHPQMAREKQDGWTRCSGRFALPIKSKHRTLGGNKQMKKLQCDLQLWFECISMRWFWCWNFPYWPTKFVILPTDSTRWQTWGQPWPSG